MVAVRAGIFIPGGILRDGVPAAPTNRVRWNIAGITRRDHDHEHEQIDEPVIDATPVARDICGELKIATLNITDGRNSRLNGALRCMKQMEVDIGVFTETKFSNDKFTKAASGYTVVGTLTDGNKGGVAIIYRDGEEDWVLESIKSFGPNVIRGTIVTGQKRYHIIGAYIPPSEEDGRTLDCIAQARDSVNNHRWPTILLGDLNCDLARPEGNSIVGAGRRMETAALMSTLGLKSISDNFVQRGGRRYKRWTWRQRRQGVLHGAVCDVIASDDPNSFLNCQIREPRFDTDHMVLVAKVRLSSKRHHRRYARSRSTYPIPKLKPEDMTPAERLLAELTEAADKGSKTNGRDNSWISDRTWKLMDRKADARKMGSTTLKRALTRVMRRSICKDRTARAEAAANEACIFLERSEIRNAFGAIKGWYKDVGPRPPKPSREEIDATRAEYEKLYTDTPPVGDPIPILVEAAEIDDDPPTEGEVTARLSKMKNHKAAGASGITADTLKEWQERARPKDPGMMPDPASVVLWEKVVELVQMAFTGDIPRSFCNGILVLIPKSNPGEYRGIALLEAVYKLVSSVISHRIISKIEFDDAIHGFRPGRGTGTAILEAKLLAQLRCRTDEPVFMVFLDLKKAYDTLDRDQAMRILEGYGVGANIRRILTTIWSGDTMIPRQAGYYGKAFRARRGVRTGDIVSPLIFNIMVDAVVRQWRHTNNPDDIEDLALFYADDGMISGGDPATVQRTVDQLTAGFASVGLKMNAIKTEYLTMTGGKRIVRLSQRAYNRMRSGEGLTQRQRALGKVLCPECGTQVSRQYLKKHQMTKKCQTARLTYSPRTPARDRLAVERYCTPVLAPRTYLISIPRGFPGEVICPVDGCDFQIEHYQKSKCGRLRQHFQRRHVEHTIMIGEEGQLPRCNSCGVFSRIANTQPHLASKACKEGTVRRHNFLQARRQEAATEVKFQVNGRDLKKVRQFKYLGRLLDDRDDDDHAALRQLRRARDKWGRISQVLRTQNVSPRARGYFYKAVVQAILLYGSETWTLSERMLKNFRSFHHRVARHLTGRHIRQLDDGSWYCPPTTEVLDQAGLQTIDEYIRRRRVTVRRFATERPLYRACVRSSALSTNVHKVVWWKLD